MIESDRHRYQQVLLNLIANANKFTKHGTISIQCDLQPSAFNDAHLLVTRVRDDGIGIK
jgi:two-component system, sensor histidine kinase